MTTDDNILLAEWTGQYGGVPAFDKMSLGALRPALEAGMASHLAEIAGIANNSEPPTFDNTIVAMERCGRDLDRVFPFWGIWSSNLSTPEFREIQGEMAPRLAEFQSKILQNQALFDRVRTVYEGPEMVALRSDQKREPCSSRCFSFPLGRPRVFCEALPAWSPSRSRPRSRPISMSC